VRDADLCFLHSLQPLARRGVAEIRWVEIVNQPQTDAELNALRRSVRRGCPLGSADWTAATAKELKLGSTLRQRGRPRKD